MERGERIPRIDTAIKLAASVDIEVVDLVEGLGWEPGTSAPGRFRVGDE